jgi:hypothetical protein
MSVVHRIEKASDCEIIKLKDREKHLYTGCGWKIARFENSDLVEFFEPKNVSFKTSISDMANDAIDNAQKWLKKSTGETWLVMCSCYELSEPRQILMNDVSSLAKMCSVFYEELAS